MCLMWQNEHCRCERPSQLRFHECLPSAQTRRSCHQHGFTSNSVKYGLQIWLTSTRPRRPTPPTEKRVQAASTDVCRLGRRMLRQSSSAVATSREGHHALLSDREGQHRQWDGPASDSGPSRAGRASDWHPAPCRIKPIGPHRHRSCRSAHRPSCHPQRHVILVHHGHRVSSSAATWRCSGRAQETCGRLASASQCATQAGPMPTSDDIPGLCRASS